MCEDVSAGDVGIVGEREAGAEGDGGVVVVCRIEAGACGGCGGKYLLQIPSMFTKEHSDLPALLTRTSRRS